MDQPTFKPDTASADPARASQKPACPVPRIWRRLGVAAFVFFLIKGLLWLLIPAALATGLIRSF
jgi:hypothetical protein